MKRTSLALLTTVGALATAAPASAGTLTLQGSTYVYTAAPGEQNRLHVRGDDATPGEITIHEEEHAVDFSSIPGCVALHEEWMGDDHAQCPRVAGVRVALGDRDDFLYVADPLAGQSIAADGGPGNDELNPGTRGTPVTFSGGAGNDVLEGHDGDDVLDGGPGDDDLYGADGADRLRGGDGTDALRGDFNVSSPDLLDGGPGVDAIDGDWTQDDHGDADPITVTLDGRADDGHAGEGDNVVAVERVKVTRPGRFVAGADPVVFDIWNLGAGSSSVQGSPGADDIRTWDLADTIDAGAGDDTIEGGNGDDAITGGPGRDTINADAAADSCNFLVCRLPHGNDTVHVRDGEADSVECGVGTDRVIADAADTVAPSCETVERGSGAGPGPQPAGTRCVVADVRKGAKLRRARKAVKRGGCAVRTKRVRSKVRKGRVVRLSHRAGKRLAAGARVTIYVSRGRR